MDPLPSPGRRSPAILPARISISRRSARIAFLATRPPASTQEFPCSIGESDLGVKSPMNTEQPSRNQKNFTAETRSSQRWSSASLTDYFFSLPPPRSPGLCGEILLVAAPLRCVYLCSSVVAQ